MGKQKVSGKAPVAVFFTETIAGTGQGLTTVIPINTPNLDRFSQIWRGFKNRDLKLVFQDLTGNSNLHYILATTASSIALFLNALGYLHLSQGGNNQQWNEFMDMVDAEFPDEVFNTDEVIAELTRWGIGPVEQAA